MQAERMMRFANKGSLEISHLPPNPHPIPNITGPLTDPQTDFFLSALELSHIWTRPSGLYTPSSDGVCDVPDIEVFVDRCGSSGGDPNQLSISDDEEEDTEVTHAKPSAVSAVSASACIVDPNEIEFDDENDWNSATETATTACVTAMKVQSTADIRGLPGLPAGVILRKIAVRDDVISFDDDIQIVPDVSKSSFGLNLPPAKSMSLPCPVGPKNP